MANVADGFAKVAPKMKRYIEQVMFGFSMDDSRVMMRLNYPDTKTVLFRVFVDAINQLAIVSETVRPAGEAIRARDTNAYPTTRPCVTAVKTIFDKVPWDSPLERDFVQWLDTALDVLAFFKNEIAVHFDMEYVSERGGLRSYRPDFVIVTPAANYIVETKGWEDLEVARKDLRATQWCSDATGLTNTNWRYLKVEESLFRSQHWSSLTELEAAH